MKNSSTYISQMGPCISEIAARPSDDIATMESVVRTIVLRCNRSATCPVSSAKAMTGKTSTSPTRPIKSLEPVRSYTSQPTAAVCICTPIMASKLPDR